MEEMELKDQIFGNLATLQLTGTDAEELVTELKQDKLVSRVLSHILAQADARGLLMVGQDLDSEEGVRKARTQQLMSRGLAEAVEMIVDLACETKEKQDAK